MVLFGELVIPSSRALWDDDFDYSSQDENISLEWKGDASVPTNISNILMIETSKLSNIALSCVENEGKPLCYLADTNIKVYKLKYNNYLILCSEGKNVAPGEVIEMVIPWLENAERLICITSNPTAMFQKDKSEEMPSCFIKGLSSKPEIFTMASLLDVPNLITGFSAGAISYCHHINKPAVLYVCYTDSRPLDSLTANPILELLENLNIPTDRPFTFKAEFTTDSNLYM